MAADSNCYFLDSAAEKEVIRKAYQYLDIFIVQTELNCIEISRFWSDLLFRDLA